MLTLRQSSIVLIWDQPNAVIIFGSVSIKEFTMKTKSKMMQAQDMHVCSVNPSAILSNSQKCFNV
jgi:hypothetical protein